MAGLSSLAPKQLLAIAFVRSRMFVNRVRTRRGKLEAISRILVLGAFAFIGLGPAVGFGFGANYAITSGKTQVLTTLLWLIFLAWQFLPMLVVALTEPWDPATLLRFPVSLKTYSLVSVLYGSLEPATIVAGSWLLSIFAGITFAVPSLALWTALILFVFALSNLLLSRLVIAWLARWLAQKRTREIISVLFILFAISNQLVARVIARYLPRYLHSPTSGLLSSLSHLFPPGLAADAINFSHRSLTSASVQSSVALLLYATLFALLLGIRIRAEYRGENLSEAAPREQVSTDFEANTPGIERYGIPTPIVAIFEKELRVLSRSTQLIVTIVLVPPLVLLVFGKFGASGALGSSADLGLAFGLANAILALTRLIYNNLGAEGAGVQFYYLSPVTFRQVAVGKNLAHAIVLAIQCILVFAAVLLMFGTPSLAGTELAVATLLFAAILNITAGNLLTFIFPKRDNYSMNRRSGSAASGLVALLVQFSVMLLAAPVFIFVRRRGIQEEGAVLFLLLSVFAFALYQSVLNRLDRTALRRRDTLITELCRTS